MLPLQSLALLQISVLCLAAILFRCLLAFNIIAESRVRTECAAFSPNSKYKRSEWECMNVPLVYVEVSPLYTIRCSKFLERQQMNMFTWSRQPFTVPRWTLTVHINTSVQCSMFNAQHIKRRKFFCAVAQTLHSITVNS